MKRHISAIILMLCLAVMIPVTALAAEEPVTSGSCGESATWSYDTDTKTLSISGSGDLSTWNPHPFQWKSEIEKVEFNGNITEIGNRAFEDFTGLTSIVIPDSVTTMGDSVFWGCTSLSHVVIPASVTEFRDSRIMYEGGFGQPVFQNCPLNSAGPIGSGCDIEFGWTSDIPANAFLCCPIKSIVFPDGLRSIGEAAFAYNNNLTSVTIPDTVTSINKEAFFGCRALEQVEIPASVIRINEDVFENCIKLDKLSVAAENKIYSVQDGVLFNKEMTELIWVPRTITSYTVPQSVTKIGDSAFQNCSDLVSITLPEGLNEIGNDAFSNCISLTELTLPSGVTGIGFDVFSGSGLTSLVIPNGAASNSYSFEGCTALTEVTLPGSSRCYRVWGPSLAVIKMLEGTQSLYGTFSGLTTLTTVYLPASLTEIGANTFANCANLTTVYFAGSQAKWDAMTIEDGNQELSLATVICTGTDDPTAPDQPENPDQPVNPDTPADPGTLEITAQPGGLGQRLTVRVQAGHWLTVQTRRAGSIAISSIQAPGSGEDLVTIRFSAPAGSILQVWETAEELVFSNGVPVNPILNTAVKQL